MKSELRRIVIQLQEIKEDIDGIDHHQTDRIVKELEQAISELRQIAILNEPRSSIQVDPG